MNKGDGTVQLMLHYILALLLTIWQIEKTLCYPPLVDCLITLPCGLGQDLHLYGFSYLMC